MSFPSPSSNNSNIEDAAASVFKFAIGDLVQHIVTGDFYGIVGICVLEATNVTCYAYLDRQGTVWVRPISEMEDGRFTPVSADQMNAAEHAMHGDAAPTRTGDAAPTRTGDT